METLIAGKAAVLDRTNQQEVDAYNKLMKTYEDLMIMEVNTPKESKQDTKVSLDKQMEIFKKNNPGFSKNIPKGAFTPGKEVSTAEGFDLDIHSMREKLKSNDLK